MKNISNMLQRGNLSAKERFILLIQNDVHRMKTGEDILTPADKEALENWKAQNSEEAKEWNRLNEGWKHSGRMELEVLLSYKDAQVAYLTQLPIITKLLYYPSDTEVLGCIKTLKNLKKVTLEEAIKIGAKQREIKLQEGMDFDYAAYKMAFEITNDEDRKRMNELYQDIETDHQYLDQEEVIANLYDGKTELTAEAKKKLATLVAEQAYNKFAKEYQLFHYFACIPLAEVGRHFLKSKGIEIEGKQLSKNQEANKEDEATSDDITKALEKYALEKNTTVKAILEEGCLSAIENGLLSEYTPLAASNGAELLKRWLEIKARAKAIILKHIESGELKLRERTESETLKDKLYSKGLYDSELAAAKEILENLNLEAGSKGELDEKIAFETFDSAIITGESLYALKESYQFLKEFKERIDTYDPNLGLVYSDDDIERKVHLDRELLICPLTESGEASFFSPYGMAIDIVSIITEKEIFFEEVSENGEKFLQFKDPKFGGVFKSRRDDLVAGYASLLAFEDVFKRLSKVYEADMTHHVSGKLKALREYMQTFNDAILIATNSHKESKIGKSGIFRQKDKLRFKEELLIDYDAIAPNIEAIKEHEAKLKNILGEF